MPPTSEVPVAVLAPTGRDGAVAERVLGSAGFQVRVCPDMAALCAALAGGAGALLVAEEALVHRARASLALALEAQPSWSDVPLIILTGEEELSRAIPPGLVAIAGHSNVTLLERPVRVATLVTALRSALRARRRQLEMRDYLEERLQAERALRESEARLRGAVVSAPYPLMLCAEDGQILHVSNAWCDLTGFACEELTTIRDWTRRAYPRDSAAREAAILAEFDLAERTDGAVHVGEVAIVIADGTERIWDFHVVGLGRLGDGRRLLLVAATDVTEVKRLLESERTARQQAEEANKAKSDFLATMSHELRTPLNAIAGYTQLLSLGIRGPVTPEQQADLARIARSQRHLLSLINDVLNFAKIEAGHVQFDLEPVRMDQMLRELESFVGPQLQDKRLRYEAAGTTGAVAFADEEKTRQILLNLLSNAIKFTGAGGTIRVGCAADDGAVRVTVSDDGQGIPTDKLEAIFEPFVQIERGFSSTHEGTGLGLAISRDLARRMGGELEVASRAGEGSVFTLTLPRATSDLAAASS